MSQEIDYRKIIDNILNPIWGGYEGSLNTNISAILTAENVKDKLSKARKEFPLISDLSAKLPRKSLSARYGVAYLLLVDGCSDLEDEKKILFKKIVEDSIKQFEKEPKNRKKLQKLLNIKRVSRIQSKGINDEDAINCYLEKPFSGVLNSCKNRDNLATMGL